MRETSFIWNHNEVVLAAKRAFSSSCWSMATIIVRLSSLGELTRGWSSSVSDFLFLSFIVPFPLRIMTPRGLMMSGRSNTMPIMRLNISAWSDASLKCTAQSRILAGTWIRINYFIGYCFCEILIPAKLCRQETAHWNNKGCNNKHNFLSSIWQAWLKAIAFEKTLIHVWTRAYKQNKHLISAKKQFN